MSWEKVGIYRCKGRKLPWLVRWFGEINPATDQQRRYSKSFALKREAEDFADELKNEFKSGKKRDKAEEAVLDMLCQEFLRTWKPKNKASTKQRYKKTFERLTSYFGKYRGVRGIKRLDADRFMAAQTHHTDDPDELLSDASRNSIIRQCRTLFQQAMEWEMTTQNPFSKLPTVRIAEKPWHRIAADDYLRLLEAAPTLRWRATYALAFTTGARLSALFNAVWTDVDFEAGVLHIRNRQGNDKMPPFTVKDKECRVIPLPSATLDILAEYQQVAPEGVPYILLTPERYATVLKRWHKVRKEKGEWNPRYLHNNVLRDFRSHAKRAGIKSEFGKLNFHELRKSAAQNWADSGLPINVTKEFLGHADVAITTKHYSKVDALHMDYATKAMNEMLESAKQKVVNSKLTDAQQTRELENDIKKDDAGLNNTASSSVSHATEGTSKSAT